jgi:tetratricopeptide (TPR) repeat protein
VVACLAGLLALGRAPISGGDAPKGPSPNDYVIDLASFEAGGEALLPAPSGRTLRLFLEDRVPSAAYSVEIPKVLAAGSVGLPPEPPIGAIWPAGCPDGPTAERRLSEAVDEAKLPELRRGLEAVLAQPECQPAEDLVRAVLSRTRPFVAELELARDQGLVDVTVSRTGESQGTPGKTWHLHISAPVDWRAIDDQSKATFTAKQPAQLSWRYRNEDEWLTAEVLSEVATWVQRARGPGSAPEVKFPAGGQGGRQGQKITVAFGTDVVTVDPPSGGDHVWSPEAFRSAASALLAHFGLKAARAAKLPPSALGPLTEPRNPVLLSENQRISTWLAQEPLVPEAHEQAALLLGAFGLREAAGPWSDTRSVMCAMTAHLALAQSLRPQGAPMGPDGVYASLLIDTLAGRERPTLLALASLKAKAQGPERAWNTALTLRNNHDWRILKDAKTPTLLERLEEFRALVEARGAIQAFDYLSSGKPDPLPDWGLIAVMYPVPVQVANSIAPGLVPSVQAEVGEVWKAASGKPVPTVLPFSVLNEPAGKGELLSWQRWSDRFRREALQAAEVTEHYYAVVMSLPNEAQSFRSRAGKELQPIPAFVLLQSGWQLGGQGGGPPSAMGNPQQACAAAASFLQSHPEDAPARTWDIFERRCPRSPVPRKALWFVQPILRGTLYQADLRLRAGLFTSLNIQDNKARYDLVLCEYGLQSMLAPPPFSLEVFRKSCGDVLDYNTAELYVIVQVEESMKSTDLRDREKLCELETDECLDLGERLAARRLDDQAAAAYQKAVDHVQDEVRLANSLDFLVDYEFDHGRRDKAESLARRAGRAGSDLGLETLGRFFERVGNYDEAIATYREILERYNKPAVLDSFYIRYSKRHDPARYRTETQQAMARLFPDGLKTVALVDFKVSNPNTPLPPQEAGAIPPAFPEIEQFGVRNGDMVMALDGYRVHDWFQARCVRSFTDAPTMTVIVRRQGALQEIKGNFRRLRYGPASLP